MSIDLEPRLLRQVQMILKEHVPDCEVWAFGSRVGSPPPKRFSDLDLAVIATEALPSRRLALLAYAFEESDLPIKVDVVDWRSTTPAMQERIAARHEILLHPNEPLTSDACRHRRTMRDRFRTCSALHQHPDRSGGERLLVIRLR